MANRLLLIAAWITSRSGKLSAIQTVRLAGDPVYFALESAISTVIEHSRRRITARLPVYAQIHRELDHESPADVATAERLTEKIVAGSLSKCWKAAGQVRLQQQTLWSPGKETPLFLTCFKHSRRIASPAGLVAVS